MEEGKQSVAGESTGAAIAASLAGLSLEEEVTLESLIEACPRKSDFSCLSSLDVLKDPVTAMDGRTYSRVSIHAHMDWCASQGKPFFSPISSEPMESILVPSGNMRSLVAEYVKEKEALLKQVRELQQKQKPPSLPPPPQQQAQQEKQVQPRQQGQRRRRQ